MSVVDDCGDVHIRCESRLTRTSKITSLAIARRAGMLPSVTAVRDVTSEWLGERTLSYHSMGINCDGEEELDEQGRRNREPCQL